MPEALTAVKNGCPRIWVHAVSAGEVVAAIPILRELRTALPGHELLMSVITPAGHEMAEKQAASLLDGLFYFPFDLPWVARRVVARLRPDIFVTLESELWPNLLHELKKYGTRTVMVNGRISAANFARTQRFARGLFRWMLSNMDLLLMQSASDAERIRALGPGDMPGRIGIVGNSKFDQEAPDLTLDQIKDMRIALHLPEGAPILVAGSTRSAEEEAVVLAAYRSARSEYPDLCLIIAPRHLTRVQEVETGMRVAGLDPVRRTTLDIDTPPVRHLILDTMGELADTYAVADVAFVGNTFPPVVQGGGQNLLQPLAHGKPVLFGPHIATIKAEAALAVEAGVGFKITDAASMAAELNRLLTDTSYRAEVGVRARALIDANQGASVKYARAVAELSEKEAGR